MLTKLPIQLHEANQHVLKHTSRCQRDLYICTPGMQLLNEYFLFPTQQRERLSLFCWNVTNFSLLRIARLLNYNKLWGRAETTSQPALCVKAEVTFVLLFIFCHVVRSGLQWQHALQGSPATLYSSFWGISRPPISLGTRNT